MFKSLAAIFLGLIMVFAILPGYDSFADKPSDKGKPDFAVSVKKIIEPKTVRLADGRIAEKQVNIFYKEGFSHVSGPPVGKGKCFDFFAKGAIWKNTEDYIVNPTNSDGLSVSFVTSTIATSVNTWDSQVGFNIFGTGSEDSTAIPILDSPDDDNIVIFGTINNANIIAVTVVWGVFSAPPPFNELIAWDIVFNDAHFAFGNADTTSDVMDLENIATHEVGHALGLAHPKDNCHDETMFASAGLDEIKKRTLNPGDIKGINHLY